MAIISNGQTLALSVKATINRVDLDARIPEFVQGAEAKLFRVLRTPEMETKDAAFSITANEYVAAPTGFLEARSFNLNSSNYGYRALAYLPPDSQGAVQIAYSAGTPRYFSVVGTNFRFAPVPDATYTATLVYWKAPTTVSTGSTEVNWLLTAHPDIYLYGAVAEAYLAIQEYQTAQIFEQKMANAIGQLERQGQLMRWGGGAMMTRVA